MTRENIILVGTGDYYQTIVNPSLTLLQREGRINLLTTVSTRAEEHDGDTAHHVRSIGQPLHALLHDFKLQNPIVLLGHTNQLHTPDAQNLLHHGYRIMLEKPYAMSDAQLKTLRALIRQHAGRIVLLEYYMMMKTIPLQLVCGAIRRDSFYLQSNTILRSHTKETPPAMADSIAARIGRPIFVAVDILEGEGNVGRVDHRGPGLTDTRLGGGMIHDLGGHAIAPLMAIERVIGAIDASFTRGTVRTARCRQYIKTVQKKFRIPASRIGESYAEITMTTSRGIPIRIAVGKYLPADKNQRRIVIIGTEGRLFFDLSSCTLYSASGEELETRILESPKQPASKYYPVIRAGLDLLQNENPFTYNPTDVAFRAQQCVLAILYAARTRASRTVYNAGTPPHRIFPSL